MFLIPCSELSSGVQSWVQWEWVSLGFATWAPAPLCSSVHKGIAKQALKACISPARLQRCGGDSWSQGVSAMNIRAQRISHGAQRHVDSDGHRGALILCSSGRLPANTDMSHHVRRKAAEVTLGPAVRREAAGTEMPAGTSCNKKQQQGHAALRTLEKQGWLCRAPSLLPARTQICSR